MAGAAFERGHALRPIDRTVIWSSDGLIVTNHHVVTGSSSLAVVLADGGRLQAERR